ncbi:MAG: prepilin peptidase [Bacteroidota bacterium]
MHWLETIAIILGSAAAVVIAYQDLRQRIVRLIPVLVVFVAGIVFAYGHRTPGQLLNLGINAGLVTGILLMAGLILRLLKLPGFINRRIGLGDVLLFYAIAPWLPPLGFALFLPSGMVILLTGVLLLMLSGRLAHDQPLPIAGGMTTCALIFVPLYYRFESDLLVAFGMTL